MATTTLLSGHTVPIVIPEPRGIDYWDTENLAQKVHGPPPLGSGGEKARYDQKMAALKRYLERMFYENQNTGSTRQDRAVNFAAANAFQIKEVFETTYGDQLELDDIDVEEAQISSPGRELWSVRLMYLNPKNRRGESRRLYLFDVDVSEPIPVLVGPLRHFHLNED